MANEWKGTDQRPEDYLRILIVDDNEHVVCGYYDPSMMMPWRYGDDGQWAMEATHWQHLPAPPEQ